MAGEGGPTGASEHRGEHLGAGTVGQGLYENWVHLAVLEISVEEVKNDMMRRGVIESAVGFDPPQDLKDYYVGAIAEIEDM